MSNNEFECFMCKKIYGFINNDEWNNEKAEEEFNRNFGNEKNPEKIIVCDNCYEIIKPSKNQNVYEKYLKEIE